MAASPETELLMTLGEPEAPRSLSQLNANDWAFVARQNRARAAQAAKDFLLANVPSPLGGTLRAHQVVPMAASVNAMLHGRWPGPAEGDEDLLNALWGFYPRRLRGKRPQTVYHGIGLSRREKAYLANPNLNPPHLGEGPDLTADFVLRSGGLRPGMSVETGRPALSTTAHLPTTSHFTAGRGAADWRTPSLPQPEKVVAVDLPREARRQRNVSNLEFLTADYPRPAESKDIVMGLPSWAVHDVPKERLVGEDLVPLLTQRPLSRAEQISMRNAYVAQQRASQEFQTTATSWRYLNQIGAENFSKPQTIRGRGIYGSPEMYMPNKVINAIASNPWSESKTMKHTTIRELGRSIYNGVSALDTVPKSAPGSARARSIVAAWTTPRGRRLRRLFQEHGDLLEETQTLRGRAARLARDYRAETNRGRGTFAEQLKEEAQMAIEQWEQNEHRLDRLVERMGRQ